MVFSYKCLVCALALRCATAANIVQVNLDQNSGNQTVQVAVVKQTETSFVMTKFFAGLYKPADRPGLEWVR